VAGGAGDQQLTKVGSDLPAGKSTPSPNPYAGSLSNPLLSPSPTGYGISPQLTPVTKDKITKYVSKLLDPESTLDLIAGQTRVLVLKGQPFRVQAGDEAILGINVINPKELLLQGKGVGATVLNIWFGDPNDVTKQETLSYLVRVFPDPEAKERLERAYKALEDDINRYFKDSSIRLKIVGDKLVVSGRVRDYIQGGQILQIIRGNMGALGGGTTTGGQLARVPLVPPGGLPDPTGATAPPPPEAFQVAGGPNVINLLEVAGEQQVLLRVLVAEVNRAAARSIGMNFNVTNQQGITVFNNSTGPISGATGVSGTVTAAAFGSGIYGGGTIPNLTATFNAGRIPFAISALKTLSYARSLAEPNLVAMNGVPATFQAGGQFPVPIISSNGGYGSNLQGVSFVPYGVQLAFTPFITDRDRIRLSLGATISTRDLNSGTSIGGGTVSGLNTRNVFTTVELRQGETLAVAGLIEYNLAGNATKIPLIGEIPGLNNLTGLQQVQASEKELIIFVTPELTRPLDLNQVAKLPGSEILDPGDLEFYLMGRIEGHCKDNRSPIRTDLSRVKMFRQVEQTNIYGPAGYSPQQYP
jgi:pilus assembly protein CpaC